jgi:hypothetical protein
VSKNAGYALIASGVVVVAVGVIGAINSGGEDVVAGTTGAPTGETIGSETVVTGPTAVETGPTAPEVETPEEFLPLFAQAIREGDARFLFSRLHPSVVDLYGARQCRASAGAFVDPEADFVFVSTSEPGEYPWEVDGVTTPVEDVLTVQVTAVAAGEEIDREIHLGIIGTELRWFTDCGEPA